MTSISSFCGTNNTTRGRILVVTGIDTPSVTTWTDSLSDKGSATTWLDAIQHHSKAPGISVFGYSYPVKLRDKLWQSLLDHGKQFLEHVLGFIRQSQVNHLMSQHPADKDRCYSKRLLTDEVQLESCPILLISHSLSGVIVKEVRLFRISCLVTYIFFLVELSHRCADCFKFKAVRVAYEQQGIKECRAFLRQLSGVILFGTPHANNSDERWRDILLLLGKFIGKNCKISSNEVDQWAKDFSLAGIDVPMLVAYGMRETKIPRGKFGRSKRSQVSLIYSNSWTLQDLANFSEGHG